MKFFFKAILLSFIFFAQVFLFAKESIAQTITIVGTADLQGMMQARVQKVDLNFDGKKQKMKLGGIDRIATLIRQIKKENPYTVAVSTGDDLMNRFFHTYKGKAILSLLSDAGYDLYAFGNHEFDKGSSVLAEALNDTKFEVICSDLNVSNSALNGKCSPYVIKEFNGVKVGFFSLMTEDLPLVTSERNVTMISDNVTMAKKMVEFLDSNGTDIIIALSHIGYKEDRKLAKQVKGIDLIFGGHSHDYIKEMGHINTTAIVNGGEKGSQLVVVDIPVDANKKVLHKQIAMTKIPVTQSIAPNDLISKKVANYVKQFPKAIVLGETKSEWNLHSDQTRKGESTVAAMINDLMREQFKVEIVLNNGGAFRGQKTYMPGPITDAMLKEIDEFSNYAYTFKLKGKYIKQILEWSASSYGKGGFLQPSGLRYRITLSKEIMLAEKNKVMQEGERVDNIEVLIGDTWKALEDEREYTLLSNSFLVQHAGDGYFWFSQYGTDLKNTYTTFYALMADFLHKYKTLSPKEKDGRVIVVQ